MNSLNKELEIDEEEDDEDYRHGLDKYIGDHEHLQWGGSRPRRATNNERECEDGKKLFDDYFVERYVFDEIGIHQKYRMHKHIFLQIMDVIIELDNFFV